MELRVGVLMLRLEGLGLRRANFRTEHGGRGFLGIIFRCTPKLNEVFPKLRYHFWDPIVLGGLYWDPLVREPPYTLEKPCPFRHVG